VVGTGEVGSERKSGQAVPTANKRKRGKCTEKGRNELIIAKTGKLFKKTQKQVDEHDGRRCSFQ